MIVVANSYDQARLQMRAAAPALLPGALIVNTDRFVPGRLSGCMPLASDIVLTEGWHLGRHALDVERFLRRCLAKRQEHFDDALVIIDGKLQTA
jgi:hypothetical protein